MVKCSRVLAQLLRHAAHVTCFSCSSRRGLEGPQNLLQTVLSAVVQANCCSSHTCACHYLQVAHIMQRPLLQEACNQLDGPVVVEEAQFQVIQLPKCLAHLIICASSDDTSHDRADAAARKNTGKHSVLKQCLHYTLGGTPAINVQEVQQEGETAERVVCFLPTVAADH
eukprot:GHUV01050908.1.p1 GENE.GHUV01050908.1~~GHUV01050908.1.p1  ORF type:complete len:169 (+),score=14.14 GHUV01050908.1:77-583(+)